MTLPAPCRSSGQGITSWKDTGTPWPPIRDVVFGEGEMIGVFECMRCHTDVTVRRPWERGSGQGTTWVYDEHTPTPHS